MSFQQTVNGPSRHQVWKMFDRIAPAYDRANRLLSMGTDRRWRAKLVELLPDTPGLKLVDLATGTGDVLLAAAREKTKILHVAVGTDLSGGMLSVGLEKIRAAGFSDRCFLTRGDALHLPFPDCWAGAVTMAFGIRNTVDPLTALREMLRILRPGGRALILEFSLPENPLIRGGYLFYFRHILPLLGGWIAGDISAYRYLNRTVESFPQGETFISLMTAAGFTRMRHIRLTFGIATLYIGEKTEDQTA